MYDDLGADGMRAWVAEYGMGDELEFVLSKLAKSTRVVLDLGCGYGRTAIPLAVARPELRIFGLDISEALINAAREAAAERDVAIEFSVGDMCALPYEENTFDQVLCFWSSFIHIVDETEQLRCINEVHRVLKPGATATFVLTDPALQYWQEKLDQTEGRVVSFDVVEGHSVPVFIHSKATVRKLLQASLFTDHAFGAERSRGHERLILTMKKRL